MSLEKQTTTDKIEIVGPHKQIQVRVATNIIEDGKIISSSYHRHVVAPGDDLTNESDDVRAVAELLHTPELIEQYKSLNTELAPQEEPQDPISTPE